MFCTECGKARAGSSAYCVGCGAPFAQQVRDAGSSGEAAGSAVPTALLTSGEPPPPTLPPPSPYAAGGYNATPGAHGQPPPWSAPVRPDGAGSPVPPPQRGGRRGLVVGVSAVVVVLMLVALGVVFVVKGRQHGTDTAAPPSPSAGASPSLSTAKTAAGGSPAAAASASAPPSLLPSVAPSSAPPLPSAPPTVDPQAAAQAELQQERDQDIARVPLQGQWVAQLASKYDGVTDPAQTTASGSHVFRTADILQEFQRLQQQDAGGASIFLLLSTDYGSRQLANGHVLWVTFADAGFSSQADVTGWCSVNFAPLSGKALLDVCSARQLLPSQ